VKVFNKRIEEFFIGIFEENYIINVAENFQNLSDVTTFVCFLVQLVFVFFCKVQNFKLKICTSEKLHTIIFLSVCLNITVSVGNYF
jgi:hypothetical protein